MYLIDDIDEPDFLVLKAADRFRCILHSGEITLTDGTTMVLVIFVVRRASSGLFDMFIVNKFFRQNQTTNHTLMCKKDIPADGIELAVSTTSSTFGLGLKLKGGTDIQWDELDLRKASGREEQIQRIKRWGKLRNIRAGDSNA
jgi:hypothetical protein